MNRMLRNKLLADSLGIWVNRLDFSIISELPQDTEFAQKQADKAEIKHQKFLRGYAAWKEKKRREKIKEKYAKKLKQLELKDADSSKSKDLGESMSTQTKEAEKSKVIPWETYKQKLQAIRDQASKEISGIHKLSIDSIKPWLQ